VIKLKRIIVATRNRGKLKEIRELLEGCGCKILSMDEAGIHEDIAENGLTFEENALIKARAIRRITGDIVLADDSGLEIDFLNNAPGIYTARFLGKDARDEDRWNAILKLMDGVPEQYRGARFVCCAAVVSEDGEKTVTGVLEGRIANEAAGSNGFGYDPIFLVPEYGRTLAQLDSDTKNSISHRGRAFRKVAELIKELAD
jgi:non-canonical purine NTP pyrophosphatase, rdgB/HAM1 family